MAQCIYLRLKSKTIHHILKNLSFGLNSNLQENGVSYNEAMLQRTVLIIKIRNTTKDEYIRNLFILCGIAIVIMRTVRCSIASVQETVSTHCI